jgi:hypothetical protein
MACLTRRPMVSISGRCLRGSSGCTRGSELCLDIVSPPTSEESPVRGDTTHGPPPY